MSASPAGLQKLIDICYNYSVQNSLTFNPTKSVCVVFEPKKFKLYCPLMVLNAAPLPYVDSVKYLGFMFTPESKNDVDMQWQLRISILVVTPFYVNLLNVMSLLS